MSNFLSEISNLYIDYINIERSKYGFKPAKIESTVNEKTGVVEIAIPSYYYSVESGRRIFEKKVPIFAILIWLKKIGRPATNEIAFAIQTAIYLKGIKAKRGFLSDPISEAAEPANEIMSINFSKFLDNKIKNVKRK